MPSSEPLEMMTDTFSIASAMTVLSDAAAGLGNAGDLCGNLRRALGEQLVELLNRNTGGLAERSDGWAGAFVEVLLAHEPDHLPVPVGELVDAGLRGEDGCHVFGPLRRVDEEALVVDVYVDTGDRRGGHQSPLVSR